MTEYNYYSSISELGGPIHDLEVSPVAVVSAQLQRIAWINPKLNAFITFLANQALERAKAAAKEIGSGGWRGPLHGIPVSIKDFYDTSGVRTTAAVERFKDRVPTSNAVGVAKLTAAGAIIVGKTNMHELGMGTTGLVSYYGPALNPWNAEYIPGGSSSGSAAAVASGLCYATLDTDAIGSCRLPAACCGVVGFKGTYGLISTEGILKGEAPPDETIAWLNHPGIMTRSVQDTALVLNALAEPNEHIASVDFFSRLQADSVLRVGVVNNFKADGEVARAFTQAVQTITSLGHKISRTAAPSWDFSQGIHNIEADRQSIAAQAFKDVDVLILPTTTTTVPKVQDAAANPQALSAENTVFANYFGLPAISVPCGFDARGLPLGLQIVGKPWDDATVLRLAYQYQSSNPGASLHPIP